MLSAISGPRSSGVIVVGPEGPNKIPDGLGPETVRGQVFSLFLGVVGISAIKIGDSLDRGVPRFPQSSIIFALNLHELPPCDLS